MTSANIDSHRIDVIRAFTTAIHRLRWSLCVAHNNVNVRRPSDAVRSGQNYVFKECDTLIFEAKSAGLAIFRGVTGSTVMTIEADSHPRMTIDTCGITHRRNNITLDHICLGSASRETPIGFSLNGVGQFFGGTISSSKEESIWWNFGGEYLVLFVSNLYRRHL